MALLHARHGRLAWLDSHQLDRSLVGCSLDLRCRELASPSPCRFIPALSQRMVGAIVSRYFFDVRLFHPHLHAGFSRRFRSPRRCPGHRLSARRVSVPRRDSRGPRPAPTSSPRRGEERYRQAPGMDCALNGRLRASPSDPPTQAPLGVGCAQRPSHEHERPAPRLRVRPFPATYDPAGTTASADFSTASGALSDATVPHHPTSGARAPDGHSGTPMETSPGKTSKPSSRTHRVHVTAP